MRNQCQTKRNAEAPPHSCRSTPSSLHSRPKPPGPPLAPCVDTTPRPPQAQTPPLSTHTESRVREFERACARTCCHVDASRTARAGSENVKDGSPMVPGNGAHRQTRCVLEPPPKSPGPPLAVASCPTPRCQVFHCAPWWWRSSRHPVPPCREAIRQDIGRETARPTPTRALDTAGCGVCEYRKQMRPYE